MIYLSSTYGFIFCLISILDYILLLGNLFAWPKQRAFSASNFCINEIRHWVMAFPFLPSQARHQFGTWKCSHEHSHYKSLIHWSHLASIMHFQFQPELAKHLLSRDLEESKTLQEKKNMEKQLMQSSFGLCALSSEHIPPRDIQCFPELSEFHKQRIKGLLSSVLMTFHDISWHLMASHDTPDFCIKAIITILSSARTKTAALSWVFASSRLRTAACPKQTPIVKVKVSNQFLGIVFLIHIINLHEFQISIQLNPLLLPLRLQPLWAAAEVLQKASKQLNHLDRLLTWDFSSTSKNMTRPSGLCVVGKHMFGGLELVQQPRQESKATKLNKLCTWSFLTSTSESGWRNSLPWPNPNRPHSFSPRTPV